MFSAHTSHPEEEEWISITIAQVEVKDEDPDTPGYVREDRVGRDVGDLESWVRPPWLARDETLGI